MAKIKVTTVDANHVKVEFNDYFTDGVTQQKVVFFNRADIEKVEVWSNHIVVHMIGEAKDWQLSDAEDLTKKILQVDNIDGTTTWVSLTVLGAQIAALIKA